jgi:cytochrome c oxidase subunit 2
VSKRKIAWACLAALASGSCSGVQSVLDPTGIESERIALLFWIMTWSSAAILAGVGALFVVAILGPQKLRAKLAQQQFIVGAGIAFPIIVLSALLIYGFVLLGLQPQAAGADASYRIAVVGEQWWWRVRYRLSDGRVIESANEIRLPVGEQVVFELTTADVIHSLWIPKLAGKLDMIPGRTTRLTVTANFTGISRAQCAEYCGGAHAMMSLFVIVMEKEKFEGWLEAESGPAKEPVDPIGERLFHASGCGACHVVRGTQAKGRVGPDLTHLGSRHSLAAATLPNDAPSIARWISENQHIKPENKMPPYKIFSEAELAAISRYLAGLK